MNLDSEIARWILEFVLIQPNVDDFLANSLVLALPVTQPLEPRLKKTILLRRIISELSRDSVSARTLHSLELLEEIDRNGGVSPSESMRAAYFAVAVECTSRSLLNSDEHFFKTVDQIWSRRVADLERSEAAGLACSRLKKFRKEILEAALLNPGIRADLLNRGTGKMTFDSVIRTELLERDTKKVALDCVRAYLEDAVNIMGPPLLEVAAKAVHSGRLVLKEQPREPSVRMGKKEKCSKDVLTSVVEKSVDEMSHSQIDGGTSSRSHVIMDEIDESAAATGQNVPNQLGCFTNKFDRLPSPDVNRVVQALKSSSADLHMMVEDPLPSARTAAAEVLNNKCGIMMNLEQEERQDQVDHMGQFLVREMGSEVKCDESSTSHTEKNRNGDTFQSKPNPYGVKEMKGNHTREEVNAPVSTSEKGTEVSITAGTSRGVDMNIDCDVVPTRSSLMDRNPTARTYEWDDSSVESASGMSPTLLKDLCLHSPKRRMASPLNLIENNKLAKRRIIKRWSLLEEETLRKAVEKHGKGNWKMILSCHPDIFEERTEVDLKDKWRNMTKH